MALRDNFLGIDNFDGAEVELARLVRQLADAMRLNEIFQQASMQSFVNTSRLSPGAVLMLMIPLIEAARLQGEFSTRASSGLPPELDVDSGRVVQSLASLMREIETSPAAADRLISWRPDQRETSLSVIKAFWRRFCNIPPFCGEPRG
jgi:hypothetical protein